MIARIWRGVTSREKAREYVEYLRRTGVKAYRETSGNRGAWILWREVQGGAEFLTVSMWESTDAIGRFAGPEIDRAVFYPGDDEYLIERDLTVRHYEVEGP